MKTAALALMIIVLAALAGIFAPRPDKGTRLSFADLLRRGAAVPVLACGGCFLIEGFSIGSTALALIVLAAWIPVMLLIRAVVKPTA